MYSEADDFYLDDDFCCDILGGDKIVGYYQTLIYTSSIVCVIELARIGVF